MTADPPDLWDSGEICSGVSLNVPYAGKPLRSRQACYWRVRVWEDADGKPSEWSQSAVWEMGLLLPSDWTAKWIKQANPQPVADFPALQRWTELTGNTLDKNGKPQRTAIQRLEGLVPATLFRKSFEVTKPVAKARLYSTAAGYVEVFLDGQPIGDRTMSPAQTDFEKRILYDVDAVEEMLAIGRHTLAAHLGDGFYGQSVAFRSGFRYGDPCLIMQLEITYQDGTTDRIVTDESWLTRPSPVIKNNVYAGEVYDARREVPDWCQELPTSEQDNWSHAVVVSERPTERLEPQLLPPVTMIRDVKPQRIFQPEADVWVFDFGQNFTGVVTLNLANTRLSPGSAVCLRYAEWADEAGNIHQGSDGSFATRVHQVDCYIAKGTPQESWTPSFTWHGFRYVEVTGIRQKPGLDLLTGHLVRSGVRRRGTFVSSDPHLNRVHDTALWTYESNLVSIPSDCPIRERCGWTGDAHATVTMSHCNFDMAAFWEKYLDDFRTSRHRSPAIVPGKRSLSSTPDWAVAQVLIVWEHYLNYADKQLLREHYPRLQDFMEYYHSLSKNGVIEVGYGDWCDPVRVPGTPRVGGAGKPQQTSSAVTTTGLFVYASQIMSQIAAVLDDRTAAAEYVDWHVASVEGFHTRFFQSDRQTYGSQTADAMALSFGIVPAEHRDAVARSLNRDVLNTWNGHASVGALGHRWLYSALADAGYANTALGTFHAKGHPGFRYLFDTLRGTSLWERKGAFDPKTMEAPVRSLSHPFQGGYDAWFYQGLGGIRPDPAIPGYKHFFLQPVFPKKLDWVEVELDIHYGTIKSRWKRHDGKLHWSVTIPANTSATIRRPGTNLHNCVLMPGRYELIAQNGPALKDLPAKPGRRSRKKRPANALQAE